MTLSPVNDNPYQAPQSDGAPLPAYAAARTGVVDELVLETLRDFGPWLRWLSIGSWAAMAVFASLAVGFFWMAFAVSHEEAVSRGFDLGLTFVTIAGASVFPALRLRRARAVLAQFTNTPSNDGLADLLEAQRSLWKTTGIVLWSFALLVLALRVLAALTVSP